MKHIEKLTTLVCIILLSGCGTINTWTASKDSVIVSDYTAFKKNLQNTDDQEFEAWADAACNVKVGALQRNASGKQGNVKAVFDACPVPTLIVISNGTASYTVPAQPATVVTPSPPLTPSVLP